MGFMFCDLHVSLKEPFVGGYKCDEIASLFRIEILFILSDNI